MSYFNFKRFMSSVISCASSVLLTIINPCSVKANININLDQIAIDLDNYENQKYVFDTKFKSLEKDFRDSHKDILTLDKSWKNTDKRIRYLYYKVIDELLKIPVFLKAVKDLNEIRRKKLTFKIAGKHSQVAYEPFKHAFEISEDKNKPWEFINEIYVNIDNSKKSNEYLSKFNSGIFFCDQKDSEKSNVDSHVSNKMLSMLDWNDNKKRAGYLVNVIVHESGHLLYESLFRTLGLIPREYIIDDKLKSEINYENIDKQSLMVRSKINMPMSSTSLESFLNFLILSNINKNHDLDTLTNNEYEVPLKSYDFGKLINEQFCTTDLNYRYLSRRAMDNAGEFGAELWVAAVGCGVRENSWGKEYRNYLKQRFGDKCLGDAGKSWYNN